MNYKNVKIDKTAKIAKQSVIIGDVTIGRDSCVLYYSVIRGDDAPIVIGEETNIQENCTVHVSRGLPVYIGNNVTIGFPRLMALMRKCLQTRWWIWFILQPLIPIIIFMQRCAWRLEKMYFVKRRLL